ncbi:C2 family cysteine protease [Demequina aurantiaca]|uniref:C2 family cysteine protease n=1 Tax=Demequina aurantiaca TaxID=676200 RepID=UPI000A509EE6|nr:C2 family cysteine protease [Demequina aurantiaca]
MVGLPGSPEQIQAVSAELVRHAAAVDEAQSTAKGAQPEVWRGAAADAYTEAVHRTLPDAVALAERIRAAGGTLSRYAAALDEAQRAYEHAQIGFDRAVNAIRRNPLDVGALLDIGATRMAAFGAQGRAQQAAAIAASELRMAAGGVAKDGSWWNPFSWGDDDDETVPDKRVTDNITDDDSFDPDDVSQGSIGDCFMLSSVVSLLDTDGGDEFIQDNVRWDEDKDGYWVTIYKNGSPTDVFVENVFDHGARQSDADDGGWWIFGGDGEKPSIAALYESAIREEYGYDFIEGGVPADAMEIITGRQVDEIKNDNHAGLSTSQIESLGDVLADGGQVVISSPRSGDHTIDVTGPDGESREIDIVNTHSYAVTRVESNGDMWMRNPWGPGNSADGGGEFRVSADDVGDMFWRATSTNVTD